MRIVSSAPLRVTSPTQSAIDIPPRRHHRVLQQNRSKGRPSAPAYAVLSSISNDVRDLQSRAIRAAFALDFLLAGRASCRNADGALRVLEAFVFTAGIGENSALIRARIAAKLAWLGAVLDPRANTAHASRISAPDSRVALYAIPTDEELMIARHALAALCPKIEASPRASAIQK